MVRSRASGEVSAIRSAHHIRSRAVAYPPPSVIRPRISGKGISPRRSPQGAPARYGPLASGTGPAQVIHGRFAGTPAGNGKWGHCTAVPRHFRYSGPLTGDGRVAAGPMPEESFTTLS